MIIDGKKIANEIKLEIQKEVSEIKLRNGKIPHLAAVLVGNDGGSESYIAHKIKACEQVGFNSTLVRFENTVSEIELLSKIQELNNNADIDGYIVQLPLPKHISTEKIIETIHPAKDVDGFTPINLGRMIIGMPCYIPATPFGIITLFEKCKIETSGKNCVVIGRSNIVGRPMSILLSEKGNDATVTLVHSKTKNIKEICKNADIIIAAIGVPEFLTADMVKNGAVVIDVGTTRIETENGSKLFGDVKFDEVAEKCSFITPVPGGVGPMTIVSLMKNTLLASKKIIYS